MENWSELYIELAEIIQDKLKDILHIDLWHEQANYLANEIPFPSPAIFISFNILGCEDISQKLQNCTTQLDFYLFYETFAESFIGSDTNTEALNFLNLLTEIHKAFHGVSGKHFSSSTRVGLSREDTGGAGNLYKLSFTCNVVDASAQSPVDITEVNEITISREAIPEKPIDTNPLFIIV